MSFSAIELAEYANVAERLADAANTQTLPRFRDGAKIVNKCDVDFDPVTDADREGERIQRAIITELYPHHGILGEEFGETPADSPWRWVLDPVDGTRAFICGAPSWVTLIALEYQQAPVLGLLEQPFTQERWIGFGDRAVYRRGGGHNAPCQVSDVTALGGARLSTTDPRAGVYFNDQEAAAFGRIAAQARVARFSLDAYAYGLLAIGELDLVIETGLKRHDFAALVPVVEGAGGIITNWSGDAPGADERGEIIASATPALHESALALLSV